MGEHQFLFPIESGMMERHPANGLSRLSGKFGAIMDHAMLVLIRDTTTFIESHLLEPLNLDVISDHVCMSKFHLLRIWKGATGTGLMEYVRRRRLACSLEELLKHHNSMDCVAQWFGFGSDRAYSRAFHEEYGRTPARWRRRPEALDILDRFNPEFLNTAGDGLVFYKATTLMPAFDVAGLLHVVDAAENRKTQIANRYGNTFFHEHRKRILNPVDLNRYIGLTTMPGPRPGTTWYLPSLLVDRNSIIPDGMTEKHISAHKYGVFTYMGMHRPEDISSKTLAGIWSFVNDVWKPTMQFQLREEFHFESVQYARCNRQYCECDLYYPIATI
jgi:AraC family transcriptional regulator